MLRQRRAPRGSTWWSEPGQPGSGSRISSTGARPSSVMQALPLPHRPMPTLAVELGCDELHELACLSALPSSLG